MSQPPHSIRPPDWRRPRGVAAGTWKYVNERSIADHYDAFVADTPLCNLDEQFVAENLPPSELEPQTVLDLGCGTGRLAIPLAQRGYQVVGIDLSQRMLEQMLAKARAPSNTEGQDSRLPGNLTAVHANLVELDCLVNDSADHAICMFSTLGMVQGRDHRNHFLRHVARAVRPGGTLILHVHRRWAAIREPGGFARLGRSFIDSLVRRDAEFGDATYAYRGLGNMFMHRFTARELKSDLACAGWTVTRIARVGLKGDQLSRSTWNSSGLFFICRR